MDERTNCLLLYATDPVSVSYYNASRSLADSEGTTFNSPFGDERECLQCATPDTPVCGTGDGDDTFVGWDADIWNFGATDTLPVLSDSAPCRSGQGDCRLLP